MLRQKPPPASPPRCPPCLRCENDFFDLATEHFARGIERRLGELPRSRALSASERQAMAQALAGALIAQLRWWTARKHRPSPERMDEWFHRFAWAGIAK